MFATSRATRRCVRQLLLRRTYCKHMKAFDDLARSQQVQVFCVCLTHVLRFVLHIRAQYTLKGNNCMQNGNFWHVPQKRLNIPPKATTACKKVTFGTRPYAYPQTPKLRHIVGEAYASAWFRMITSVSGTTRKHLGALSEQAFKP